MNELVELGHLPQHEALALKVTDMSNVSRVREVRETLIRLDRMKLALRLCAACDVETYPVYAKWGISLIRSGKFPMARVRVVLTFVTLVYSRIKTRYSNINSRYIS